MCIFLIIMTIIIGWLYSLKFEEFMDGFINGVKEMLVPAFYAVIANIVFATLYRFQSSANIYYTIVNFLMTTFIPTSILLVAGLSYMKISYKEWFKYIWKYLLEVLVIGIIIFIIVAMFI